MGFTRGSHHDTGDGRDYTVYSLIKEGLVDAGQLVEELDAALDGATLRGSGQTGFVTSAEIVGTSQAIVQLRMREGNELTEAQEQAALAAIESHVPKPPPDGKGLLQAVDDRFGKDVSRLLAKTYPDAVYASQVGQWDRVREAVNDMLLDEAISQEDYDAIQGLMVEHGIPEAEER